MRTIILAILCLFILAPAATAVGPDFGERELTALDEGAMRLDASPPAGDGPPGFIVSIIPEFYYGDVGALATNLADTDLSMRGGESTGFGISLIAQKIFNPTFSLSFIYQYAYTNYSGGNLLPTSMSPLYSTTRQHAYSNMAGFIATINLGRFGIFEPSFLQGWDAYHGNEQLFAPDGAWLADSPVSVSDDRASSLMFFHSLPIPLSESLTLTPYVGWRSVYVVINTLVATPQGTQRYESQNEWAHLVSGGLSLKWSSGPLSLILRGGFNHRVSKDDVPGLSSRAVAPGVTHLGWHTSFPRTIGTYGVALDYHLGPALLEVSYDGFSGGNVTYHKGAAVLVFFF